MYRRAQGPRLMPSSIPEEVTLQDRRILHSGGTSSTIERLPSRLQRSKTPYGSRERHIQNLNYEIGYLKAELAWHTESKRVLLQLQEQMYDLFYRMEDALVQVNVGLHEAEQRYLNFWGLSATGSGSSATDVGEEGMI